MSDKIKYDLKIVLPKDAQPPLKAAYKQMTHDVTGVHEPFLMHSAAPDILLGLWSAYRETLLAKGKMRRDHKEIISVIVSELNRCPWCYEAHSISLHATGASRTLKAIKDKPVDIDEKSAAIIEWTRATRTPGAAILANPPFSAEAAPEMIGLAVVYHYMTRMVNVLLVESALPQQQWVKAPMIRLLSLIFAPFARRSIPNGETLALLPDAPLPVDLQWAASNEIIAGAFARFAHAIEEAASRTVPAEVCQVVQEYLSTWQGDDPGMSRRWVDELIAPLNHENQTIAKLALLGAISPHHVDEGIINEFRAVLPDDKQLIELLSWACFSVARRIGTWLQPGKA